MQVSLVLAALATALAVCGSPAAAARLSVLGDHTAALGLKMPTPGVPSEISIDGEAVTGAIKPKSKYFNEYKHMTGHDARERYTSPLPHTYVTKAGRMHSSPVLP